MRKFKNRAKWRKILGWHVIISAFIESTWNKLSDLNAAYMPNSDNSDCKYGMLLTVIIVPPSELISLLYYLRFSI